MKQMFNNSDHFNTKYSKLSFDKGAAASINFTMRISALQNLQIHIRTSEARVQLTVDCNYKDNNNVLFNPEYQISRRLVQKSKHSHYYTQACLKCAVIAQSVK